MKKMINRDSDMTIDVSEFKILTNGWEYYLTDEKFEDEDIRFGLVMGFETELGYVSLSEISPYIMKSVKVSKNTELFPAQGWEWE